VPTLTACGDVGQYILYKQFAPHYGLCSKLRHARAWQKGYRYAHSVAERWDRARAWMWRSVDMQGMLEVA
jgi:hypothetical protein